MSSDQEREASPTRKVDVKTAVRDKRRPGPGTSRNTRTAEQVALGVKILLFIPGTRKLRFVEHKE